MVDSSAKLSVLEKHGFTAIDRFPSKKQLVNPDAPAKFFVGTLAPKEPFVDKKKAITAFGSCFAENITRYLAAKGYRVNAHKWKHANSDLVRIDELMVHTPALLRQFEWALDGRDLGEIVIDGKNQKLASYHTEQGVRDLIQKTEVFIVTFGLSEAWFDKETGEYLWKFIPRKSLDSARFENRRITVQENINNIERIYALIRANCPNSSIVFTLSPVPMLGTYRGIPCSVANAASKASLRVALDEVLEAHRDDDHFHYFPSYELVNHGLDTPFEDDNRHVTKDTVAAIMDVFHRFYCEDDSKDDVVASVG